LEKDTLDSLGKLTTSPRAAKGDLVKFKDYAGNEVLIERQVVFRGQNG
jgi:hypothetical protein